MSGASALAPPAPGRGGAFAPAAVKGHIARVLAKLGLRDRAQVVVLAYETRIVRPGGPGYAG
jgi:hypothetical protein